MNANLKTPASLKGPKITIGCTVRIATDFRLLREGQTATVAFITPRPGKDDLVAVTFSDLTFPSTYAARHLSIA